MLGYLDEDSNRELKQLMQRLGRELTSFIRWLKQQRNT